MVVWVVGCYCCCVKEKEGGFLLVRGRGEGGMDYGSFGFSLLFEKEMGRWWW